MALSLIVKRTLVPKTLSLGFKRNNGYIVLVPEIGEEPVDKNPLLKDGLPIFDDVTIEKCMVSITKQTVDFERGVKDIEKKLENKESIEVFKDIIEPLEELGSPLDLTWGLTKTLYLGNSSRMPTKSYLAIHDRAKRARASKFNKPLIYSAIKEELNIQKKRSTEEERILKKYALEGKLNGLELKTEKDQMLLHENLNKLSKEIDLYKQKVELSTKKFSHFIQDFKFIEDMPAINLKQMASNPLKPLNGPWKATLQENIYLPVMEYCSEREIRWNVWQAMVSRGSGYTNRELVTSTHLELIRSIRNDVAKLLDYPTYADMSMETKMAGSVANVKSMIETLLEHSKPAQDVEVENLYQFACERGFKAERLELWDVSYWKRKQLKTLYDYNEEDLRKYFPLPTVVRGLFQLCEKLFKIVIMRRSDVSTWHKDVMFFDIFEPDSSAPVAGFYLDNFSRTDEKVKHHQDQGWMVGIQNRSIIADTKPIAALIFNFRPPENGKPSLLTFKEVTYLFHKFGQALQHLLSKTKYSEVSGLSNLEWDAVEVCGHFLTHWLFNKEVIDSISSHCDSGEPLPQNMFDTLTHVRKHMAGVDLSQELYLSSLDLELHSSGEFWLDIVRRLWDDYRSFTLHKLDSHPCSFTKIFVEDWAAAYYSHTWSKVIAADVYSAFHEVVGDDQKIIDTGKRFRETFLTTGGSCHPSQIFRQFRGRDPSPKALLFSLGLNKA